jgi:methyl-accepting chemotaxis protein
VLVRAAITGAVLLFVFLWLARDLIARAASRDILLFAGIAGSVATILTAIVTAIVVLPWIAERSVGVVEVLQSVARGDLSRDPPSMADGTDGDRLSAATRSALSALRSSITEVRSAARDLSSRAKDFTLQHTAAVSAAVRMTESSAAAAHRGAAVHELSRAARGDVERVTRGTASIVDEARAQRSRDQRLRERSRESLAHLERGVASLNELTAGVSASAEELALLSEASEEIRSFVTLVRKMARQSKLLALNAAMEAARAGEHGSGFAVVAGEVRRLAKSSNEAADRTDQLVSGVLERLENVRAASARAVDAVRQVSASTTEGISALRQLEAEPGAKASKGDDDISIVTAASDALALRLEQLTREAESLSRSLQESSTHAGAQQGRLQDIAGAVNGLGRAANRALTAANGFRSEQMEGSVAANDDNTPPIAVSNAVPDPVS